MAIPYTQSSIASVRAVDGTYISYPFIEDGDSDTKVYNLVCTQRASDYDASQVSLDTPMTDATAAGVIELPWTDSSAYFVGDTGHASSPGGMLEFTRTFANIPQSITVPSGSEFYTFPGISRTFVQLGTYAISSMTTTPGLKGVTITTSTDHSFVINSEIHLLLNYKVGTDPFINQVSGGFLVTSIINDTTFTVDLGRYWNEAVTFTDVEGSAKIQSLIRNPTPLNSITQTRYDYILPGVSTGISSYIDINVPPAFQAVDTALGLVVDTLEVTNTRPNISNYTDMIKEQRNIVIESSLSEWAGNILVMKTKTCKAR